MQDGTEQIRRALVHDINSNPRERADLEADFGQVWDTTQLTTDFAVEGFLAPFVMVVRKSDGRAGMMMFQHSPRYYFSFEPG